ncbi:MAG: hypothetical protein RI897_2008 [Verrucomicrobiota bacterium]
MRTPLFPNLFRMSNSIFALRRAVCLATTALVMFSPSVGAWEYVYSPTATQLDSVYFNGSASVGEDSFLLTPNTASQQGSIVIDNLPKTPIKGFAVEFGLRMYNPAGTMADGISFGFGPGITTSSVSSEKGISTGLAVAFDSYVNTSPADPSWVPGVSIRWNGVDLATQKTSFFNENKGSEIFHNATITLEPPKNPGGLSVVTVEYGDVVLSAQIEYAPSADETWRMIFSGRTGSSTSEQSIDEIHIEAEAVELTVLSRYGRGQSIPAAGVQGRTPFDFTLDPAGDTAGFLLFNGSATQEPDSFLLTPGQSDQDGTILLHGMPEGRMEEFTARFGLRLNDSSSNLIADGVSFSFGPGIELDALLDEAGVTNGLAISFNTYNDGGEPSWVPGMAILWNGEVLASTNISSLFENGRSSDIFHDVVISLQPTPGGAEACTVTLDYQGVGLAAQIPFAPATNELWRAAFGARTGGLSSEQAIDRIQLNGTVSRPLVPAEPAGDRLTPVVGFHEVTQKTPTLFQAPEFVYLDQYRRELDPTPDNISSLAHYRARLDNPAATVTPSGGAAYGIANGTSLSIDRDTTVTWHWVVDNLAEVDSGTSTVSDLSATDITDAAHVDTLGRRFLTPGSTGFDSLVYRSVQASVQANARFGSRGYVMENAPNSPEHFLVLSGEGDYLRSLELPSGTREAYTIEFWARRNVTPEASDQVVFGLGSSGGPGQRLLVGFGSDTGFYIEDGSQRISALPGWTDEEWHHWAVVYRGNGGTNSLAVYRDSVLIESSTALLEPFRGDMVATVGARAVGDDATAFFSGGVNNVRVWNSALDRNSIRTALATREYGPTPGLILELPFDEATVAPSPGVHVEHFTFPAGALEGRLTFEIWEGLSTSDNNLDTTLLAAPDYPDSPSLSTHTTAFDSRPIYPDDSHDGYGGRMSGWITPTETSDYTFFLRSDDTSRLFISPDDNPQNMVLEAYLDSWTDVFSEPGAPNTTRLIHLEAGKRYAIEAIWKEGLVGDFCQVAWRLAGDTTPANELLPISGDYLLAPTFQLPHLSQLQSSSLVNQYTTNNFLLPSTNDVPLQAEGYGSDAWYHRSGIVTPASGRYTFSLSSSGPAQFRIDGHLLIDMQSLNGIGTGSIALSPGSHVIETLMMDYGGERSLSVSYSSDIQAIPLTSIPDSSLLVAASDLLAQGQVTSVSAEGSGLVFVAHGFEELFSPDTAVGTMQGAIMPGFRLGLTSIEGGQNTVQIDPIGKAPLDDWRRVFWNWNKEFLFQVGVTCSDESGIESVSQLPYFAGEVSEANVDGSTSDAAAPLGAGVVNVLDLWLREGEVLTVGTVNRTVDRRYTLSGITGNLNFFSSVGVNSLVDGLRNGQVTRQYTFPGVFGPGNLNFSYGRTIHRINLALGQGFDVSSLASANAGLYPELPVGSSKLAVTVAGPSANDSSPQEDGPPPGGSLSGWEWDYVSKTWYPTKPGIFTLTWPDITGYTNTIKVTAGFPGDSVVRSGFLGFENKDGSRQGITDGQLLYLSTNTFPEVIAPYPGAPRSHYTYNLPPNGAAPAPADLDPFATDDWYFKDLAFAENNTAQLVGTKVFTDTLPANRSVVVFTRRTDPQQAATGNMSMETVTVRVVNVTEESDEADALVAERVQSDADGAGFLSGAISPLSKNYNPAIYNFGAAVGEWGPVYPVNDSEASEQPLIVGWYQNTQSIGAAEPPTYQPIIHTEYTVSWPDAGNSETPVIYLSSQMGSEGVGQGVSVTDEPNYQMIWDPELYDSLVIYNQPDRGAIGYNPNEEHAFIASSKAYQLTGDPRFDLGQSAAFALQNGLNSFGGGTEYTSEPFVLVQYSTPGAATASDAYGMQAYAVLTVRTNESSQPFPHTDPETHTIFDVEGGVLPQPSNPTYDFSYVAFAGQPVVAPYPLSLAIGNVVLTNTLGGNIAFVREGVTNMQRSLWEDRTGNRWTVSGGGRFFQRYWYPSQPGFWVGDEAVPTGTPVAWAPENVEQGDWEAFTDPTTLAAASLYETYWGSGYPILKKGETLTYAGGEYVQDHPSSPGLPAVVDMASVEVVYDDRTPSMMLQEAADVAEGQPFTESSVRVTRPLDRIAAHLAQAEMPDTLQPSNPAKVLVAGSRWYFKDLDASLGKRFYYDSLAGQLVFRGLLNNLESGDPDLTQQPVQPYVLQPNFLTEEDVEVLLELPGEDNEAWTEAVENLYEASITEFTTEEDFGLGVVDPGSRPDLVSVPFYEEDDLVEVAASGVGEVVPLSSLGVGSALVATPEFLTSQPEGPEYVVLAENNDPGTTGVVALHIIQLTEERYRGSVEVLTPQDPFSENINLQHTGDFGGNTAEIYYQWWIHEVTQLSQISSPDDSSSPTAAGWQVYQQGLGLNSINFEGDPVTALADKFFFVRYGAEEELMEAAEGNEPAAGIVADASWRNVLPGDSNPDWASVPEEPVPFQWAGAANSPQLQADGSRRYLPQLVMGWVKRVLDQVNLYEARYSATFSGDAPATYSSMLMEAGGPYIGDVALNADKNSLENVGLIQLYETVLGRAKELSALPSDPDVDSGDPGTDQAILLAATRLAFLYQLLGSEAFADAQNFVVPQPAASSLGLSMDAFAFKNQVANPQDEELALLRGTDFIKAYPAFNRLFWNYFKADGEAFYNATYNIQDLNDDGLIDETDAALQYPMGHGDAWGHYLSSIEMHYELLRRPGYGWLAQSELYSLLGNVLPVDYLDEKTFATIAADKVRAGEEIIKATYRDAYVSDPEGQWQGYEDTVEPSRAWGVSEWSRRVGQGAWFDWMAANAVTPATASATAEGLDRIDRATTLAETASVAAGLNEVQDIVDQVNRGLNPLGLDSEAMAFQADPYYDGTDWERVPPFRQSLDKAIGAARNAVAAYEFASQAEEQLKRVADDTRALQEQAILQDLDYKNRLIELYGTPYQGAIGPGQVFAEGYSGPDTLTYMYIDAVSPDGILPEVVEGQFVWESNLDDIKITAEALDFDVIGFDAPSSSDLFEGFYLPDGDFGELILNNPNHIETGGDNDTVLYTPLPISETADYAFQAPSSWGRRAAVGEVQRALNEMLEAQIELDLALEGYNDYTKDILLLTYFTKQKLEAVQEKLGFVGYYQALLISFESAKAALEKTASIVDGTVKQRAKLNQKGAGGAMADAAEAVPKSVGAFNGMDLFSTVRAALIESGDVINETRERIALGLDLAAAVAELSAKIAEISEHAGSETIEAYNEFLELLKELSAELKDEERQRAQLMAPLWRLKMAEGHVRSVVAEGERLVAERAALNRQIAAKAQRNRYADLVTRLNRTEAMRKYDLALDNALRHAWLTVKTYDYETSLSDSHPASATKLLEEIVKTRTLGNWADGEPHGGNGGLAEILEELSADYDALQGQIGLNNSQGEANIVSLRSEMMRISPLADSDNRWRDALAASLVADLWRVPEFAQYCRPFAPPSDGAQPGLVVEFSTQIASGKNFFGRALSGLDHAFSPANYATKIRAFTAVFQGYDVDAVGSSSQLSISPRFYLVPVGLDLQYCSDTQVPTVRSWDVVSQRIPVPYVLNEESLGSYDYQPTMNGLDGAYAERIRFGDSRAFISDYGLTGADEMTLDPLHPGWNSSSRLYGRSAWNTRWLLIIPGATLSADKDAGLARFIETVTDIKLYLETYSNQGM